MTARQVVEQHADAPSADIAARLEAAGALVCEHGRISCATFCGVECSAVRLDDIVTENAAGERDYQSVWEKTGPWKVISLEDRLQWADEIDRLIVRDEARLAARHRVPSA